MVEPVTIGALALGGLIGGAGRGGGSTRQTTNTNTNVNQSLTNPTTQTFGLALTNNPTIANMIGAGSTVAPASGGASLPQSVSPTVSTPFSAVQSPNQSQGGDPSSVLPRASPLGNTGLGAGFAVPRAAVNPNNDLLLLLLIGGGALLLLMGDGKPKK